MRTAQRVITALVAILATLGLGATAAQAAPAVSYTLVNWSFSSFSTLTWDWCEDAANKQSVIFLEENSKVCGVGPGDVYSFSSIVTHSFTNHVLEICQFHTNTTTMTIDQADGNGNSTGILHRYSDSPGGSCNVVTITYPVRKYMANWGGVDPSLWALPV